MREVVVMAADRPDEGMPALQLAYDYRTGDPDVDVTATATGLSAHRHHQGR